MLGNKAQGTKDSETHETTPTTPTDAWACSLCGIPGCGTESQEAQAESGSLPNSGRWSWGLRKFKGQQLQGRVAERTAPQRHRRTQKSPSSFWTTYIVQQVRTGSTARERILPRTRGNTTGGSQKARINSCAHCNSQGVRTPGRVISWCSGETSPRLLVRIHLTKLMRKIQDDQALSKSHCFTQEQSLRIFMEFLKKSNKEKFTMSVI